MRPLRFSINITLDGCYDHEAVNPDVETHRHATESIARADALIFGRVTYELMEGAWREPARTGVRPDWMAEWTWPFARTIDKAKKYVVSDTLPDVDWNAEVIPGKDLESRVRQLKDEPGDGLFVGGVRLAQALTELRLIDEYVFLVHPRLVGRGPTFFTGLSRPVDLTLVGREDFSSGAVGLRYRLA